MSANPRDGASTSSQAAQIQTEPGQPMSTTVVKSADQATPRAAQDGLRVRAHHGQAGTTRRGKQGREERVQAQRPR